MYQKRKQSDTGVCVYLITFKKLVFGGCILWHVVVFCRSIFRNTKSSKQNNNYAGPDC